MFLTNLAIAIPLFDGICCCPVTDDEEFKVANRRGANVEFVCCKENGVVRAEPPALGSGVSGDEGDSEFLTTTT